MPVNSLRENFPSMVEVGLSPPLCSQTLRYKLPTWQITPLIIPNTTSFKRAQNLMHIHSIKKRASIESVSCRLVLDNVTLETSGDYRCQVMFGAKIFNIFFLSSNIVLGPTKLLYHGVRLNRILGPCQKDGKIKMVTIKCFSCKIGSFAKKKRKDSTMLTTLTCTIPKHSADPLLNCEFTNPHSCKRLITQHKPGIIKMRRLLQA